MKGGGLVDGVRSRSGGQLGRRYPYKDHAHNHARGDDGWKLDNADVNY